MGRSPRSSPTALPWSPNDLGMDGPVTSASIIAVAWPRACMAEASRLVTRDLPTPPFPLTTPITFLTLLNGPHGTRRSFSEHFDEHVEQSWVHSSLILRLPFGYISVEYLLVYASSAWTTHRLSIKSDLPFIAGIETFGHFLS